MSLKESYLTEKILNELKMERGLSIIELSRETKTSHYVVNKILEKLTKDNKLEYKWAGHTKIFYLRSD